MAKNNFRYSYLFLLIIFPLSVFLSFNKHSKDKYNTYHSVIWADASGYYVYLPMLFIYDNVRDYPDSITEKVGKGFSLDTLNNFVFTKYPCGVAILEAPFFLLSHLTSKVLIEKPDGFSRVYHWGIMIAAIFYACLGMYFLSCFLQTYFSSLGSFLYVLILYASTNLYYYTIDASGMSHAFSFFLFSVFIYLTPKFYRQPSIRNTILLTSIFSLIILIRPTNALIGVFVIFFNDKVTDRIMFFRNNLRLLWIAIITAVIVFLPQMMYWKMISGKWIFYSYGEEGFIHWENPQLLKVWFSTNNGFFVYAPIMILSVIGMITMIRKKISNGALIFSIFILASYAFASWWNWWFGCSYGSRSFIEFYALLIIPLAWFLESLKTKNSKWAAAVFILACIAINMNIIYYYDGCFWGGDWDWMAYFKLHQ